MGKPSINRDFVRALRRHWKSALPNVRPLSKAVGSLPAARSFYAGIIPSANIHVFVHFQPHKNIGGQFTIDIVLSKDEASPRHYIQRDDQQLIGRFKEGPNRIGLFVRTKHGDKWWVLSRDEHMERFSREYGLPTREEDYWYPISWEDQKRIVVDATTDVTSNVASALRVLGLPGAGA